MAAALLAIAAITACQPAPGGGSDAPPSTAPASGAPAGEGTEASATPYQPPGY